MKLAKQNHKKDKAKQKKEKEISKKNQKKQEKENKDTKQKMESEGENEEEENDESDESENEMYAEENGNDEQEAMPDLRQNVAVGDNLLGNVEGNYYLSTLLEIKIDKEGLLYCMQLMNYDRGVDGKGKIIKDKNEAYTKQFFKCWKNVDDIERMSVTKPQDGENTQWTEFTNEYKSNEFKYHENGKLIKVLLTTEGCLSAGQDPVIAALFPQVKYSCATCDKIYAKKDKWISCDDCTNWYCEDCAHVTDESVWKRKENVYFSCICCSPRSISIQSTKKKRKLE